ncbi:MAG: ABC transporter ATP-binding protein, partial [Candidatus Kapaibacteriota bacterium]
AQEAFSGIRLVRAFVREAYETNQFNKLSKDYRQKYIRLEFLQSLMIPLLIVLIGLSQLIVIGYGGLRVIEKTMTIGVVSQFFVYINLLIWPVAAIGWVTNLIQRANASIDRLWEVLDIQIEDVRISHQTQEMQDIPASIHFENVWFRYNEELPWVLKGLSLQVLPCSSIGVIGSVGSGKSTIMRLITKIYAPNRGKIFIGGIPLNEIPRELICNFIAFVPQEPFLFSDTIAENVRLGKPNATDKEVELALSLAGFDLDLKTLPDGMDTFVGERGVNLSGGQKQRVAIARALIAQPKILLLDDAFSSVDTQTEQSILSNIFSNFPNTTKIIISNRISSVMHCDKIFLIDDGRIVEEGNHHGLLYLNGMYRRLYEIHQLSDEIGKEN